MKYRYYAAPPHLFLRNFTRFANVHFDACNSTIVFVRPRVSSLADVRTSKTNGMFRCTQHPPEHPARNEQDHLFAGWPITAHSHLDGANPHDASGATANR